MEKSKQVLNDFIISKSQFFNIADGEEEEVKFLYAESVTTNFGSKSINSIRYHLEVKGKELCWDRTSRALAAQMRLFSEGDYLLIKRTGERNKTVYKVEKVEI
ncbi:MAG: hypothetical protein KKA52_05310 [Candidatus Omnitrophica bacterium]|nr:hypothetical protein [Candidatus Omnitrophota bacterium]